MLRPQFDPLCGDLINRLINKKYLKSGANQGSSNLSYLGVSDGQNALEYEEWNISLAKRFNSMFKNYRKFSIKYFGIDP